MPVTKKGGWKVISVYPKTVIKIWIFPFNVKNLASLKGGKKCF